ncbi:alpha/beta hydrolase fold [Marinitoga hydrogenitolerans DSM 16785]|uniref:Alpha/beta hydrolase fold n=1 Tax=Marinitoga hydrogenitolerans (strain DSM 16785 / JCM 12826 / AT1271) TaxID=1122195 RepID=A0A1M4XBJ0_MARH1|nr:alpha/beta hydrolase fold [Marinitoga hydrogenitolerans DSM 16785]
MFFEKKGIYYEIYGEGKPLILLNGIMMNTLSWASHIKVLSKYFKIIVYDMRDQVRSEKLEEDYDISIHVEDLHNFIIHLGLEKVNILGLSY